MIEPTVGRIVHYFFAAGASAHAALLVGVHHERSINLAVFNDDGSHYPALEVPLLQDDDTPPAQGPYAAWMPFQKGQAMKLDAAESALLPRLEALEQLLTAHLPAPGGIGQGAPNPPGDATNGGQAAPDPAPAAPPPAPAAPVPAAGVAPAPVAATSP